MTSIYLILPLRISQLLSHNLKLNILSNHAEHLKKGLVLCYVLPFFTILKSLYPMN